MSNRRFLRVSSTSEKSHTMQPPKPRSLFLLPTFTHPVSQPRGQLRPPFAVALQECNGMVALEEKIKEGVFSTTLFKLFM